MYRITAVFLATAILGFIGFAGASAIKAPDRNRDETEGGSDGTRSSGQTIDVAEPGTVAATVTSDARVGDQPSDLFRQDNLVAWCIVPFDAKKRGPAERAAMLKRLGIRKVAYDWRAEHIASFEQEILEYQKHGLEYFAFWSWHEAMAPLIKKHKIHPQIWITNPSPSGDSQAARIAAAANSLLPVVTRAAELGCKFGLYNHGGWGGQPENLVAVCEYLRSKHGSDHVGIVYNFHHGHEHIQRFKDCLLAMKPYLLCVNLNGMVDASKVAGMKNKILTIGEGTRERAMLQTLASSGYRGPIGILDHRSELDAEESLRSNLTGLKKLVAKGLVVQSSDTPQSLQPRAPWTKSRIRGTPTPPAPYRIRAAFPKLRFDKPSSLEQVPGENRILVTEMGGKVYTFPKQSEVAAADIAAEFAQEGISVFSATFHPRFRENRYVYLCMTHPQGGLHTRVTRYKMTEASPPKLDRTTERIIIKWPAGGHNGGCLKFNKDGYLYISTGDGWGPNPPDNLNTGQDVSDLLGSILRIDVDRPTAASPYSVPADNPFVGLPEARPEIWAYGLRNPWKFGVDLQTNDLFVADNGWETWEMVHRIVRGSNCGWPIREGRALLRTEIKPGPTPIRPPIKDHSHTEANSVIGGPVYRGSKLPELTGCFVYGDYITGTIWSLQEDPESGYNHRTLLDTDQRIVAFAEGSDGELFVLDYDFSGQIYELLPSGLKDTSASFPRRLSETGLVKSLAQSTVEEGVIAYDVKVSRWLDGAVASRFVAIPGNGSITLGSDPTENQYPDGTVFVKHLRLPLGTGGTAISLETQILHYENGTWNPYSYVWDERGQEAHLVEPIGTNLPLNLPTASGEERERTWHVGAANECKLCHNAAAGYVLGFNPLQLNYAPKQLAARNQLASLRARQVIQGAAAAPTPELVDPYDRSHSLEDRARSYLHVNCSMCHHPRGSAIVSFYLKRELPLDELNTNKGTNIGTFGIDDAKILTPGDPYRSLILYRMAKLGYARMPYIGSQVVDSAGVALVAQWIKSLSDNPRDRSTPLLEGSPAESALEVLTQRTSKRENREQAIKTLLGSTEGALALAELMHSGTLEESDTQAVIAAAEDSATIISGLIEHFIPEEKRRVRLGKTVNPQTILELDGDGARGKLIYFSDNARCRNCHALDDKLKSVGPTLTEISKKYPRESELLQHILQPSLKIEDPFKSFVVATDAGQVVTGLMVSRSQKQLVLRTSDGKDVAIAADKIEAEKESKVSLMPQLILSDLTAQEAADLVAFISGLSSAER